MIEKRVSTILLTVLITLGLGGCNTMGVPKDASLLGVFDSAADDYSCMIGLKINGLLSAEGQRRAAQEISGVPNDKLTEPCKASYRNNIELRLLRAHLLAAVVARYGAARVEDYSKEKVVDATRLNLRLHNVMVKLDKAVTLKHKGEAEPIKNTPVIRADLYEDFIALAAEALNPTIKEMRSMVFASPAERISNGGTIFKNALEDELYKDAYAAWMKDIRLYITSNGSLDSSKQKEAWSAINAHLIEQCKRVADLASADSTKSTNTPDKGGCKIDWQ